MIYQVRKVICYTLIAALFNTSFYPLYAVGNSNKEEEATRRPPRLLYDVTGRYPTREASSVEKSQPSHLPWGLRLDDWLKKKAEASAQKIQDYTPGFIKETVSDVYNTTTHFLTNMINDLPDHLKSNTSFFDIDYAHDRNFWLAHFGSEIQDLKTSLDEQRLKELQSIVWNGLLSPYEYEEGLLDLKSHYKKTKKNKIAKIKKEFRNTLRASSCFVTQNLHGDLLTTLEETRHSKKSMKDVDLLLTYYRDVQNPLAYTEDLVGFRQFIQRNKSTLNLSAEIYGDLNRSIVNAVKLRDEKQYSLLKAQRKETQSILREMPFYDADIPEEFNSSLPPVRPIEPIKEEELSSWTSTVKETVKGTLKGAAKCIYSGMKHASEHPFQTLCTTLYTQFMIVSALKAFDVPRVVDMPRVNSPANDNENQKNSGSKEQPRNLKRSIDDEFSISQNSTSDQGGPSVTILNNGNIFTARHGAQTGIYNVYGGLFFPNKTAITNDFFINQNTTFNQGNPSGALLPNGNVFMAWHNIQGGILNINGREFSPTGIPFNDAFPITQNNTFNQAYPAGTILNNGNVFLTWMSQNGDWDLKGCVLVPNGTKLTQDFPITQNTTNNQWNPSLVTLLDGNVFETWFGFQAGDWDIYGRVFFPNGTTLTDEFRINQITTGDQIYPSIVRLKNGKLLIVWGTKNTDIAGRVFFPNGTPFTDEFQINQNTPGYQTHSPSVTNFYNDALVTWEDLRSGDYDITGRIISPEGLPRSDEFGVTQIPTSNQVNSKSASFSDGSTVTAWASNQTGIFEIEARILTNDTLSSYLYPTSTPSTPSSTVTPSSPTPPSSNSTVPPSPITPSSPSPVERSSSSTSTADLWLEIGIPTFTFLTLGGIGGGSYLYYKKKKRRGILVQPLNSERAIEMGPVSSQNGIYTTISPSTTTSTNQNGSSLLPTTPTGEYAKFPKTDSTQEHVYENVPKENANATNQYTTVVTDSTNSQFQTLGSTHNQYVNVHLTVANGNNLPQLYGSSMTVSTSSQPLPNQYENVHAVSNGTPQGNQYVSSMPNSNTVISQYETPTLHQPIYEGVPENITNPANQYAVPSDTDSIEHQYDNVPKENVVYSDFNKQK